MALVSKPFGDIVTFTRGSGGGIFNAQGNYEWLGNDAPRFDYDPITKAAKGLLIEEQRTNLLTYSEQFGNAAWFNNNCSITPFAGIAPNGLANATYLKRIVAFGAVSQQQNVPNSAHAASVYMKAGADKFGSFAITEGGSSTISVRGYIDLVTGAVSQVAGTIRSENAGDGWWRVWTDVTPTLGSLRVYAYPGIYTSATSEGIYIWGAQLEQGSFPTSYIPTKATFTARNSIGTYHDSTGVLRTAAANIARYDHGYVDGQWVSKGLLLEGQSTNLLTYSEQHNGNIGTRVEPNSVVAPDGACTADMLIETTAGGEHYAQDRTANITAGLVYTYSCFVKAQTIGVARKLYLRIAANGNTFGTRVLPSDGSFDHVTPGVTGGAEDVGGGWLRAWMTFTAAATASSVVRLQLTTVEGHATYQGDGTSGLYIWGAQLEAGDKPSSYIPTPAVFTSRASTKTYFDAQGVMRMAAVNEAAIDHGYIDGQWVSKGLSVEGQATNLLLQSEAFGTTPWITVGAAVTNNVVTSPDGSLSADKVAEGTSTNAHGVQHSGLAFTAGIEYTVSAFARAGDRTVFQIAFGTSVFGEQFANFDLVNGVLGAKGGTTTSTITPIGNGWYRCTARCTALTTATTLIALLMYSSPAAGRYSFSTGDGSSGLYIWGAQLEAGSQPTSYIPTTTAQVTRAADVTSSAQVTRVADSSTSSQVTRAADVASVNDLSGWYRQGEGTLVAEYIPQGPRSTGGAFAAALTGDSQNYFGIGYYTALTSSGNAFWRNGGSGAVSPAFTDSRYNASNKFAATWDNATRVLATSANGKDTNSTTSVTDFPTVAKLDIFRAANTFVGSGHIKSIKYLPRRVSNDELKALTV